MAETRTDVVVNARAKGFQQVQQQAGKLVDQATKAAANQVKGYTKMEGSTRAYRKEIKSLEKQLSDLSKQQLATMKAMVGMDKVSGVYKQLKENLKNLGAEASNTGKKLALTQQAFAPKGPTGQPLTAQHMARGGFMQGFAQTGLGLSLQRGPGMWRQAAGAATGRMTRGFAGAPFGGVEGLTQGLAGIPVVGGFLAGQMNNAMGFAGGALSLQKSRIGAMPLFGGGGGKVSAARQRAQAGVSPTSFYDPGKSGFATPEETLLTAQNAWTNAKMGEETARRGALSQQARMSGGKAAGGGDWLVKKRISQSADAAYTAALDRGRAPEAAYHQAQQKAGEKAAIQESNRPFQEVRQMGERLAGLSEQQAIDAMSAVLQRGGGGIQEAKKQGMVRAGFAAQTAYGIGPEVSGAFLQAGRRGGVMGAEGRGAEAMTDAIAQGLALGLEGSELQDYMAQMANSIASWKQTGLPINTKSIQQMSAAVAGTGLGGIRGAAIGQGLAQAGQRLAGGGVQDAVDLLMLQTMGGYKGGGMEEYEKAQIRLEEMGGEKGWDESTVKNLVEQLMAAGGGGATGRQVVQQAFGRKGIQIRKGETIAFTKSMTGETMTDEERAQANKIRAQMGLGAESAPQGAAGLAGKAATMMDEQGAAMRKAATIQNQQNDVGAQMLPTMQALQLSQANLSSAFSTLASGPLTRVSEKIEGFTKSLKDLSESGDRAKTMLDLLGSLKGAF